MNSVITHPWLDGAYYGLPNGTVIMPSVLTDSALYHRAPQCRSQCMHDHLIGTAGRAMDLCNQMLAEKKETERKKREVSQALWCDRGEHAFSAKDRGKMRVTVTIVNNDGEDVDEIQDVCGKHAEVYTRKEISTAEAEKDW